MLDIYYCQLANEYGGSHRSEFVYWQISNIASQLVFQGFLTSIYVTSSISIKTEFSFPITQGFDKKVNVLDMYWLLSIISYY